MGNNLHAFEVRVEVEKKGSERYSDILRRDTYLKDRHSGYVADRVIKMFHFEKRTHEQAWKAGEKHGRVLSVRKFDAIEKLAKIERLVLPLYNPYPDAIAMDEMIWRRKSGRLERISNRGKDKNPIDK